MIDDKAHVCVHGGGGGGGGGYDFPLPSGERVPPEGGYIVSIIHQVTPNEV